MNKAKLTFAAVLGTALAAPSLAQEKVCIEETAGVCLKYQTVEPKAAPTQNAVAPSRPASPEASAEAAMRMTAEERRSVQRSLQDIGLYDGGIDGAFGEGTRRAIARWQIDNGREATGYLTLDQMRDITTPREAVVSEPVVAKEAAAEEPEPATIDPIPGKVYNGR